MLPVEVVVLSLVLYSSEDVMGVGFPSLHTFPAKVIVNALETLIADFRDWPLTALVTENPIENGLLVVPFRVFIEEWLYIVAGWATLFPPFSECGSCNQFIIYCDLALS